MNRSNAIPPEKCGDISHAEDCEQFRTAFLGFDEEDFYSVPCEAADFLPPPPATPGTNS